MKKIKASVSILITLCLLLTFSACSSSENDSEKMNENNSQQSDFSINNTTEISNYTTPAVITTTPNAINDSEKIPFIEADMFNDGRAWVLHEQSSTKNHGLIDKTGKLIRTIPAVQTLERLRPIENNLGSYETYTGEASLIDSMGSFVASNTKGDFDLIIDCAEGMALVYKNVADITTSKHMYGLLDSSGNWVYPLTDWGVEPVDISGSGMPVYGFYAGEGMFAVGIKCRAFTEDFIIFNSETQTVFYIYDIRRDILREDSFQYIDGFAVVTYSEYGERGYMTDFYSDEYFNTSLIDVPNYINVLPDSFIFYTDGTYKEIKYDEYNKYVDDNVKLVKENGVCTVYPNLEIPLSYTISKYHSDNVYVDFCGKFGLMKIEGLDGKKYFTLIDKDTGTERFEPICYTSVSYGEEKIVFQDTNSGSTFKVLDINGNIIIDNLQYEEVQAFNDDMAVVKISENQYGYIDLNGNLVLSELLF